MANKSTIGERSIVPATRGIRLRSGANKGSVVEVRNRTIGLNGSGLTQDISARIINIQTMIFKTMSKTTAIPARKLAKIITEIYSAYKVKLKIKPDKVITRHRTNINQPNTRLTLPKKGGTNSNQGRALLNCDFKIA